MPNPMVKETIIGIEEIEKRLFNKNLRNEIVDKNIEFKEK